MTTPVPAVSVIIPTRNAGDRLRACLGALAASFPPNGETVVVSDGGAVDPGPVLADFVEPLRLRWIHTSRRGPAAARNRGLSLARGDVVAFTDDDCRPRPGWVQALATQVSVSPPRAVGGTTFNGLAANPYADAAQVVLDLVARHDRAAHGEERFFPCNNLAFPAQPLRDLGGFNESYWTAEDREVCRRWRAAGFALELAPGAVVDHDADQDFAGFVRKFYGYGRGAARFHSSANRGCIGDTAGFHLRLPRLMGPEVVKRGPLRGARLVGLLAVWEIANLAGFVTETAGRGLTAANGNNWSRPS